MNSLNIFAVLIGSAAALGLYRVSRQRSGQWAEAGLVVLALALVGARALYALENLAYYRLHPAEILQVWLGGLSAPGAVLGGLVGLAPAAWLSRAPLLRLADWLYPLLPPLAVSGWLGCWLVGSAYGPLAGSAWWGVPAPDVEGQVLMRLPVQMGAAVSLVVFFLLLESLIPLPRPAGWLFSLAATWLVLVGLAASLLRADPAPLWNGFRHETWVYLILLIPLFGLFAVLNLTARRPRTRRAQRKGADQPA